MRTSFRIIRKTLPVLISTLLVIVGILSPVVSLPPLVQPQVAQAAGNISGTVFRDFNANGARDGSEPGVGGILVTAYDDSGAIAGTDTTASDGTYTLSASGSGPYRVEFSSWASYLWPSPVGSNSGITVQFVPDGDTTDVDLGLNNPADYCHTTTPELVTNCYVTGDQDVAADVLVSFGYNSSGAPDATGYISPTHEAVANQIGTTWGLAYQRSSDTLFASAFQKRHSGYAPTEESTGAIYKIPQPNDGAITNVALFVDLIALFGSNVAGDNPHPKDTTNFELDLNSYDAVGKISLGDMDISDDESSLWTVNLADRQLYQIPLGSDPRNPTAPSASSEINRYDLLDANLFDNAPACPDNSVDLRPFAVKVKDSLVYVGMVCSGESTNDVADMEALIYTFDPTTGNFTKELSFPLNYERGCGVLRVSDQACRASANWNYWEPDPPSASWVQIFNDPAEYVFPQPMFTDIEFAANGDMIIGLRDRFGDQMGNRLFDPRDSQTRVLGDALGDILLAKSNGSGGWTTPAVPEFFDEDAFNDGGFEITETAIGGLALVPGNPDIVSVVADPVRDYSGGIDWMNLSTGSLTRSYELYRSIGPNAIPNTLGKANGLGDLEPLCQPAPIEIGNRIWNDQNRNGIQDPGESGIDGVTVELYRNNVRVGSTSTANGGQYYFNDSNVNLNGANGIVPGTVSSASLSDYEIRIPNAVGASQQASLDGFGLTETDDATPSTSGSDVNDSDGTLNGTTVVYAIPSADLLRAGYNNHTYDFGFVPVASIGDKVWRDNNGDGVQDGNEPGIDGVTVELFNEANVSQGTTLTANGGFYSFSDLIPGNYYVVFTRPDGFNPSPRDVGSNIPAADTTDSDADPVNGRTIITVLDPNENDPTWDAGFVPLASIGDKVWFDANRDGIQDSGEPGIQGARVDLFDVNDVGQGTKTTDGNGFYQFTDLEPGDYYLVFTLPANTTWTLAD